MKICDYGCGNPATFLNKRTKKWCCSAKAHACPMVRRRNSARQKVPEYQKRLKDNMMERHGVEHQMHLDSVKEKIRKTSLGKYGTVNPAQNHMVKGKIKQTCLARYGVEYAFQAESVKTKIKESIERRFGGHHTLNKDIQTKTKNTLKLRYGVDNPGKTKKSIEKASRNKSKETKEKMKQTWSQKSAAEKKRIIDKREASCGYRSPFANPSVKKSRSCISKRETKWLDSLNNSNIIRQYCVEDLQLIVDGYDPTTNIIYLFHGDFWHGNPKKFNHSKLNPVTKTTYGELYRKTLDYEQKLRYAGYPLTIMWESDCECIYYKVCS